MSTDSFNEADTRIGGKRPALARASAKLGLLPLMQAVRRAFRGDLRILAYHRVLDVDAETFDFDLALVSASAAQFRAQMEYVKKRYRPMRFHDVIEHLDAGRALP
ncbi:MAG: polysaccharide deacetylase, partial [Dokdonella sp.]